MLAAGICAASLLTIEAGLARVGPRHFLPEQKLHAAVAQGDGCLLFLGDSRMAAGLDAVALHGALEDRGNDRCLADLAIGATDVNGAFLAARTYLGTGRRPRAVVLGSAADYPLGPAAPRDVGEMVGNNAIHLIWTKPSDVFAEVPGFPRAGVAAIDQAFRFSVLRSTAFGRYQSLFARRLQSLDARLAGSTPTEHNRFGAVNDMAVLESTLRRGAVDRLSNALKATNEGRTGPWFQALRRLLDGAEIPIIVVELPMPATFRRTVTESAPARSYRAWLAADLNTDRGGFVDLSNPGWIRDDLFADDLHLNAEGAKKLSGDIGRLLPPLDR